MKTTNIDNNSFNHVINELYSGTDGVTALVTLTPQSGIHHDLYDGINFAIDKILLFLIKAKQSNNYILNETYKKHIDSIIAFVKNLQSKGIKAINSGTFLQTFRNSNYPLIDITGCTGSTADVANCKTMVFNQSGIKGIITNIFENLYIDEENKKIEQQNLITKTQAAKLLIEQQEAQNKVNAQKETQKQTEAEKDEQQRLLKKQFEALKKQAEKKRNQKLLVGGGIMALLIIGSFIGYQKYGK